MKFMERLFWKLPYPLLGHLGFALVIGACAPVVDYPEAQLTLTFDGSTTATRNSNLSGGGQNYTLPSDVCYVLHLSAEHPEFNRGPTQPPSEPFPNTECPVMPNKFGKMIGTFNVGAEVELDVPALPSMKIDLLAIDKTEFGGSCPTGFTLDVQPDPNDPGRSFVTPRLNGVEMANIGPQNIGVVGTATASIVPGINEISLQAVTNPDDFTLGRNYFCDEGGGGSSSSGGNYNEFVHLTAPSHVHPFHAPANELPQFRTSMTFPFMRFRCPAGASEVRLEIQGGPASPTSSRPCVAAGSDMEAHFFIVSLPAYPAPVGSNEPFLEARAEAFDSANQSVGLPMDFKIIKGFPYQQLCDEAYGMSCTHPGYGYGTYTTFNFPGAARFAGFRNTPGDRGIYLQLDDNTQKKVKFIPLDDVSASTTITNPFGWDMTPGRNTREQNLTNAGAFIHYAPALNAVLWAIPGMNNNLVAAPVDLSSTGGSGVSVSHFASTGQSFAFASSQNLLAIGAQSSTDPKVIITDSSNLTGMVLTTRLQGIDPMVDLNEPNKKIDLFTNPAGNIMITALGVPSAGSNYLSFVTCQSLSACDTAGANNWTGRNIFSNSNFQIIDFAVVPETSTTNRIWMIRRNTIDQSISIGFTIVDLALVTGNYSNLTPTFLSVQDGVASPNSPMAFYPLPSGTFKPRLIRAVPKLNHMIQAGTPLNQQFDLVLAGSEEISAVNYAVIYRSSDLGQSWYKVYSNSNTQTEIVDAIEIVRQDRHWDNNGQPSPTITPQKSVAFLEHLGGSPTTWKIIYQEHGGY